MTNHGWLRQLKKFKFFVNIHCEDLTSPDLVWRCSTMYLNIVMIFASLFVCIYHFFNGIRWPLFSYVHHNSQSLIIKLKSVNLLTKNGQFIDPFPRYEPYTVSNTSISCRLLSTNIFWFYQFLGIYWGKCRKTISISRNSGSIYSTQ